MPTLKDLRAAAGLSQTELANASGVSIETIKKIETGKVERPHPATLRMLAAVLGQVPVVMNGSRGGAVFDPGMFDNARRTEATCIRVVPDATRGVPEGFVPLRESTLTGSIVGPLARLCLRQTFRFKRDECDKTIEAVYRFPLPGDAAVTSVHVQFGAVVVQTSLAARAEAERQYRAARAEGRQAALATRESTDVVTLQLSGLQPDQDVVVETSFVQAAAPAGVGWELRVPLTIGPRYSRGDEAGTAASRGQPLQVWRDPRHRFTFALDVRCAALVTSPSHTLRVTPGDVHETLRVRLADESVVPDRDLVVRWEPARAVSRTALEVMTHEDLDEGMRYFLALVTPPSDAGTRTGVDREVLLLVDHSGSMEGAKWEACRWAVRRFVAGLTPADRFNLGMFDSSCEWLDHFAVSGTPANQQRALAFLDAHPPRGGTELGVALEQALRSDWAPGERARHVLLITDAQVSDENRILQLVEQSSGERRVSVISIDSAPRSTFVRSLVEASAGDAVFLSSDPHQEDITSALDRVLDTWARPLATGVSLCVETGARGGVTRSRLPLGDLPTGRSLWVSGAVSLFAEPVARLEAAGQTLAEQVMSLEAGGVNAPEVRQLFGARQIARLEQLEAQPVNVEARDAILDEMGYANDPVRLVRGRPVYAENASAETSVVRKLLVRESLRYALVCSATAFVGERLEAGRRVEVSVQVPSALPAGWDATFAAMGVPAAPASVAAGAALRSRTAARALPLLAAPSLSHVDAAEALAVPPMDAEATAPTLLRFSGTPAGSADVWELAYGVVSGRDAAWRLSQLTARVEGDADGLDAGIAVWLCVDDPHTPLVRVPLRELLALGGERPMNIEVARGARVLLVLVVPDGKWPAAAGALTVEVR